MKVTRREFLKYCSSSAAVLGLTSSGLLRLSKALAVADGPPVVWLQGAGCSGCSVSFLNKIANADGPAAADLLLNYVDLKYHPTVMAAAGELAVESAEGALGGGGYFLVVEGGIPTANNGHYCHIWEDEVTGDPVTMLEAVQTYSAGAAGVVACGTCAAYGGIPGGRPNPTGCVGVREVVDRPVINIPGCPPHPDWIIGTIAYVLSEGRIPPLDLFGRPRMYYRHTVHSQCPNKLLEKAEQLGQPGCLHDLGCNGQLTKADCPVRKWNNETNWCIGAQNPCQGCTEPHYPDGMSPFYTLGKRRGEKEDKPGSLLVSRKA